MKPGLEFNPGLVLIDLWTTGPCFLRHGSHRSGNVQGIKKILQGYRKVREFLFESKKKFVKKVKEKWNFKSTYLFFSLSRCCFLTLKILLYNLQSWIMLHHRWPKRNMRVCMGRWEVASLKLTWNKWTKAIKVINKM